MPLNNDRRRAGGRGSRKKNKRNTGSVHFMSTNWYRCRYLLTHWLGSVMGLAPYNNNRTFRDSSVRWIVEKGRYHHFKCTSPKSILHPCLISKHIPIFSCFFFFFIFVLLYKILTFCKFQMASIDLQEKSRVEFQSIQIWHKGCRPVLLFSPSSTQLMPAGDTHRRP